MTNTTPRFSILASSFAGGPRPRNAATIILGLWFVLFFAALFTPPLLDDADATHSQAARAMVITGDLVTLHVDGIRYLEKAPLPYWLVALSFRLFGFNTFAVHLPQALCVLLLALLGHRWANQAFGSRTAFYTAISILTSAGVFLFTRVFIPEVLLSLLLATALFCFLKTLQNGDPIGLGASPPNGAVFQAEDPAQIRVPHVRRPHRRTWVYLLKSFGQSNLDERPAVIANAGPFFYPYLMWAALALAVLTKGLVALIFFFGATLAYLVLTQEYRRGRLLRPATGVVLFLAIAAPWHILAGLRNTGGMDGHGFFWFYFWNEHVLRFLGRRIPMDYNKLPGYLFWTLHLVWLFPWALFLPLGITAVFRRYRHQTRVLTVRGRLSKPQGVLVAAGFVLVMSVVAYLLARRGDVAELAILVFAFATVLVIALRRYRTGLPASPFHRIDPQQRTILLLSLFAALILLFFSLSTNQEYYTFPAYLPILLLLSATITRAEQTYAKNPSAVRWITFAHAALTVIGLCVTAALAYGLWTSRHLAFVPDIGDLLAHRGVGDYTLSMSHLFDLTGPSFAALRFPAALAAVTFAFGPTLAWMLRMQRRHIAATTTIAFTSALFLIAAHIAFVRFSPMLSSADLAQKIEQLHTTRAISPTTQIMLYGDQAYGSSIPFYLDQQVLLVDGRSTSMLFGSTFPDAPHIFLTGQELAQQWGTGDRKLLFVPLEHRDDVDRILGNRQIVLKETSGKALITDRPLDHP